MKQTLDEKFYIKKYWRKGIPNIYKNPRTYANKPKIFWTGEKWITKKDIAQKLGIKEDRVDYLKKKLRLKLFQDLLDIPDEKIPDKIRNR